MKANLAAQFLPAAPVRAKIVVVHDDDKVRIAHRDLNAANHGLVGQRHLRLAHLRHTHAGSDLKFADVRRNDRAGSQAGVGLEGDAFSRTCFLLMRDPCGDAARAVTGNLCDGAVGIGEPNAAGPLAGRFEKLHPVGADPRMPLAKLLRQRGIAGALDDQEIVTAGMRLGKAHHSSSASR